MNTNYYVTMTDKFMSGLHRPNLKNKLVFICDTYEQAQIVADNAFKRSDMRYINICSRAPYYSNTKYYTQFKTIEDYPNWYKRDYF